MRDFAQVQGMETVTATLAHEALMILGIDDKGLDRLDHAFLTCLIDAFKGGPVGLDSLAASLGEERHTLEEVVEPYLVQSGFVVRTARGRMASDEAYAHLGHPLPDND